MNQRIRARAGPNHVIWMARLTSGEGLEPPGGDSIERAVDCKPQDLEVSVSLPNPPEFFFDFFWGRRVHGAAQKKIVFGTLQRPKVGPFGPQDAPPPHGDAKV